MAPLFNGPAIVVVLTISIGLAGEHLFRRNRLEIRCAERHVMGRRLRSPDRAKAKGRRAWSGTSFANWWRMRSRSSKPRYQRTRTPFNLQTIREEVEDQHGAPLADDDAAQIPGIMQRLWERHPGVEPAALGGEWWRFAGPMGS